MIVRTRSVGDHVIEGSVGTTVEMHEIRIDGTIDYDPHWYYVATYFDGSEYKTVAPVDEKKTTIDGDVAAYEAYLEEKKFQDEMRRKRLECENYNRYGAYVLRKGSYAIVMRGRKIPKGSSGLVKWYGQNRWGMSALIQPDEGEAFFVNANNLDVVPEWE